MRPQYLSEGQVQSYRCKAAYLETTFNKTIIWITVSWNYQVLKKFSCDRIS